MQGEASDLHAMMSWDLETTQKQANNLGANFGFPAVLLYTCLFAQLELLVTSPYQALLRSF